MGALVALAIGTGCYRPKSYVVILMESASDVGIIADVEVGVSQAPTLSRTLHYSGKGMSLGPGTPLDLSVSFGGGQSGTIAISIVLLDIYGCTIGTGTATGTIKQGNVTQVPLVITGTGGCSHDGGVRDAAGDIFPGCDPALIECGPGKTCQVNCEKKAGQCTDGGTGAPGAICQTNMDCAPGSQCFDYGGTGCKVKLCLRFCNDDPTCAAAFAAGGGVGDAGPVGAAGAAAVGTRSFCQGPVVCPSGPTGYHTCTFGCDPRQPAAAAKTSGCPAGLSCLVVADMDQVDCACPEKSRTGTDGASCTSSAQCAPGYICNMMSGARVCRAICRCDASGMTCMAPNDCTAAGKSCSALTNDTIFGVCL